ncbi:hypothetical protein Taro_010709 [Colocasia esculenta]|uniref:Uncharacterized protein n=1 Tax=Colocasia esculenta TaxID=4460 RepID=A0A843U8H5_COLES|nr:hypothetical protein [Colocasia esculenta]
MFSLHRLVKDVLGSWTACSRASELRGGGVQAHEKALIGWIFVLSKHNWYVGGVQEFGVLSECDDRLHRDGIVTGYVSRSDDPVCETSQQFPLWQTEEMGP